jgi:hypothetical protein
MKQKLSEWSRHYLAALQKHVKEASRASLRPARGLGHQAVISGLDKLDVAMMHTQALARLVTPHYSAGTKEVMIKRAELFFVEVMIPIEKTQRVAVDNRVQLTQLKQTLRQRTRELFNANRQLRREIIRRRTAEQALQQSALRPDRMLERPPRQEIQPRPRPELSSQAQELRS